MIETVNDILEMLKARFPGARCNIVHERGYDVVVLKGRKSTFTFELRDFRHKLKKLELHCSDEFKNRLCLSFQFTANAKDDHHGVGFMLPVNEFSADEIVKFITDNSTFKPRKIVQLDLFECMRGVTI